MASLHSLGPSAVTKEYLHFLNLSSLGFHNTVFHPSLGLCDLWFLFLFLKCLKFSESTLTSPLGNLPTVWTTAPSWIHKSNPKPRPWLQIHIPKGLLNLFTLLFSKDYTYIQCTPTKLIHFPTRLSPLPVFLIPVMESPFLEAEGDRRVSRFLLSKHRALWICLKVPITVGST